MSGDYKGRAVATIKIKAAALVIWGDSRNDVWIQQDDQLLQVPQESAQDLIDAIATISKGQLS